MEAVDTYERVSDIVDHCRMPDYQVLCALSELLRAVCSPSRDLAVSRATSSPRVTGAFSQRRSCASCAEWASASRRISGPVVKVAVLANEQTPLDTFRRALAESTDFLPDPRMTRSRVERAAWDTSSWATDSA